MSKKKPKSSKKYALARITALESRLQETQDTLDAIRNGTVDALVVSGGGDEQVFTLKSADHRYRLLVESMNEGAATLSMDGVILYGNQRFAEILKTPLEQVIGAPITRFAGRSHVEKLNGLIRARNGREELEFCRKDGHALPVRISLGEMKDDELSCLGLVLTDLTDHRHHEELIALTHMRTEFTSMISHELRTPLAAIKEGIDLVLEESDGPMNESQKKTLNISKNNVDRLARLINSVLDFTKIDAGQSHMLVARENLRYLVDDVCKLMNLAARKKGIDLCCSLPPSEVLTVCDSDKIKQVLINLMDNAIKFTPEHGRIHVRLKAEKPLVHIEIEDTGVGIRLQDQPKIFDLFIQGSHNGSRKAGGSGVGLAVCKKFIELHKGNIHVESQIGRGSKFVVTLPENS